MHYNNNVQKEQLSMEIIAQLIQEFKLKPFQVQNTVKLVDEGCTIPFIARYRKELTGELDDQVLRELHERLIYLRNLEERRADVRRLIDEQGKLTPELSAALDACRSLQEIEDVYRPYKPKRRTRASIAREKGLEPLARIILDQELKKGDIRDIAAPFVNAEKGVNHTDEALAGAMDIIAEEISDHAQTRKSIRELFFKHGTMVSKALKEEDSVYRLYYDFREPVSRIARHRILAINRGEKEEYLKAGIEVPEELMTGKGRPRA